jgi:hypothetical protein
MSNSPQVMPDRAEVGTLLPTVDAKNGVDGSAESAVAPCPAAPPSRRIAKRDMRVRRAVRSIRRLAPHLDDPIFTPLLYGFASICLLLNDSRNKIRGGSLIGDDGELRPSLDTIRRLAETQAKLAEKLGLTPSTLRLFRKERTIDIAAAFAELDDAERNRNE